MHLFETTADLNSDVQCIKLLTSEYFPSVRSNYLHGPKLIELLQLDDVVFPHLWLLEQTWDLTFGNLAFIPPEGPMLWEIT